jgi:FkbM family methyltransferase
MIDRIVRAVHEPKRIISFLRRHTPYALRKKKGTLVYLGLNRGAAFGGLSRDYKKCFGFEPNPELFDGLQKKFAGQRHVQLVNAAVATYDGEITFNISSNDGMSSSIGTFKPDWDNARSGQVTMTRQIKIPCVNLLEFLRKQNIDSIDDYISDVQGMDLEVLKTIKPLIEARRIGTIQCEVSKDEKGNIYENLPDNSESGFAELLGTNYELVATGWNTLIDGQLQGVPAGYWEMDCRWRLKAGPAPMSSR